MSIKKSIFKIFNGSSWDEYYHKTSADQVVYTKPDGTASNVQAELAAQNSAMKNAITTKEYQTTAWEYNDWAKKYYHSLSIPYSEWSKLGYPINITIRGESGIAGNATWIFSSDDNSLQISGWLDKDQNNNTISVTFLKLP